MPRSQFGDDLPGGSGYDSYEPEADPRWGLAGQADSFMFIRVRCSMFLKKWAGVALAGLILFTAALSIAEDAKEVPFPELPKGAGKISEDAPKTFTTTESGLKYRILREGKGDKPNASQNVEVHYHGWMDDGSVFDSTYKRRKTTGFPLKGVIAGWTEGLQLVGEGGMIELDIPYKLAYGEAGRPPIIPRRTDLHFIVELVDVK